MAARSYPEPRHPEPPGPGVEPGYGLGGEFAAPPRADSGPSAPTEYTSGSFAAFIAATEDAGLPVLSPGLIPPAPAGGPGDTTPGSGLWPGTATVTAPPAAPETEDGGPSTAVGPVARPGLLAEPGYVRPTRRRILAAAAALAILGVTGITGTLMVMHRHAALPATPGVPASGVTHPVTSHHSPGVSSSRGPTATQAPARWAAPVPIDPQTLPGSGAHLTALSCLRKAACYAADSAGVVLALQSAGNWPVAVTDPDGGLVALSCAAPAFCVAIDSAGNAIRLSRGNWSSPAVIGTGSGTVTSVSCAGPAFCMAVDSIGQAFTYRGAAIGWSQQTIDPSGQPLNAVSCAGPAACIAVGATGDVFRWNGTGWSAPDAVDNGHRLLSVSCPDTTFCMAVDSSGLAVEYSAGQWTLSSLGWTPTAVSCPTAGSCLAAGASGAVASFSGDRWSHPSAVDNGTPIAQLSCVASNACTAIDTSGNALSYAPAG